LVTQAEQAEAAKREAAIAAAQTREKARRELSERLARVVREREIRNLQFQSAQSQAWQRNLENSYCATVIQQQRQALLDDLERHINPSPPPPGPAVDVLCGGKSGTAKVHASASLV
jgi:multidrug efflux pump subunit AcrA (membrane-fusion protein)